MNEKFSYAYPSSDRKETLEGHKGEVLKAAREEKGLSLETVHEATKIPLDALRAIEEGYSIRILTEFYYRSFVKIYAKYLDIDVSLILDETKKPIHIKKTEKIQNFDFSFLEKLDKSVTKQMKQKIFFAFVIILALWFLFQAISFFMTRKPAEKQAKPQVVKTIVEKKEEVVRPVVVKDSSNDIKVEVPPIAPVVALIVEEKASAPAISRNITLTVRAKNESWLRVKTDDTVVFQATLKSGDVETWSANDKIEVTGKNISELEFEHNGKMISLGRSSRRAKGLIVTKEGLSVTK